MMNKPTRTATELDLLGGPTAAPLGEMLVASGHLRQEDVIRIQQNQVASSLRFGESAVELGLVSPNDVKAALSAQFGSPMLNPAVAGLSPELVCATQPNHPAADAIYRIRATLLLKHKSTTGALVLAVVGSHRGEGRTFLAANLAIAFAQVQARTTLVDADMRNGRIHKFFGAQDRGGLAAVLIGRASLNDLVPVVAHDTLSVIPAGAAPNPQELLSTPRFHSVVQGLAARNDVVIFDTPALSVGADAQMITAEAGLALVVAHLSRSSRNSLQTMMAAIEHTGARMLAVPFQH